MSDLPATGGAAERDGQAGFAGCLEQPGPILRAVQIHDVLPEALPARVAGVGLVEQPFEIVIIDRAGLGRRPPDRP